MSCLQGESRPQARDVRLNAGCKECGGPHHSLLHGADRQFPESSTNKGNKPHVLLVKSIDSGVRPVLLGIVKLLVETFDSVRTTYAVLDPGSEATLVTRNLANSLNLKGPTLLVRFGSFYDSLLIESNVLTFKLSSLDGKQTLEASNVLVVPKITLSRRKIDWPSIKTNWEHLSGLELPSIDSSKVEVLIGMDFPSAHRTLRVALPIEGEDGPTAHQTCFGWAVVGKIPRCLVTGPSKKRSVNLGYVQLHSSAFEASGNSQSAKPCKNSPEPPAANSISDEDDQMVAIINRSMTRLKCGYQIELPVKPNHPLIPNNRSQALLRFYGLERRLLDPNMRGLAKQDEQKIDNLIASGTVVLVDRSEIDKPAGFIWHLPHFFVVNNNKPDKEIRVVFDCAARYKGISLNCFLLRGPQSIPYLVGILLRARQHSVALSADITSFYHRIGVDKKHQSLKRFVFRKFGSNSPILTYQFTTLVFGEICASSAAVQTLQRAANDNVRFPHVATRLKDNFYSDNFCDSFETEQEALNFAKDVTESLASGGFALTGFASSSLRVINSIPAHLRSTPIADLNPNASPVDFIFGMEWHLIDDSYRIRVKQMPEVSTKRELLSAISLTFDPLGICLPVMSGARLLFQHIHRLEREKKMPRGWDHPLPEEVLAKWKEWTKGLNKLSLMYVSRCFRPTEFPLDKSVFTLIIFADASSVAYGAVAYLHVKYGSRTHVSFIMAKGRLAPLTPITIPRLELKAAVLAVQISAIIKKELRLIISATEFYSDSEIVLHQLRTSRPRQTAFVTAKRNEILAHTSADHWHYVCSEDNPADACTRGVVPKDFGPDCQWITGPRFLSDPAFVPVAFHPPSVFDDDETEQVVSVVSKLIAQSTQLNILKRDVAQALRTDPDSVKEPTADELANAFRLCLAISQEEAFPRETDALAKGASIPRNSTLKRVGPYIDPVDGLLKVVVCRRTVKRYGLLITCLSTRAVHLEVLDTMDADSFIMALRRFISLRGHPKVIFSDNGTNIVAGEKELREGINNLNSVRVTTEMIDRGIDWRFSPPSAPSFGGIWERLISSSKKAMKAILENRSVTDEVLRTVFAEVASLLNSRPLTNVPTDLAEPEPLTPFHFILGCANPHQAPDSESAFDGLSRRKWKQAQFITDQFWRRWMREYLPSLIERKKWDKSVRPLRVGDNVLIMDENTRRGEWLTGQITKVFPSSDNVIRKAAVKTARSVLIRPVLKLCYISGPRPQD
ncbi:uncharacterized protein LOC116925000 [Daphnia magna]|uniref:uncharacterized protein LOC116925000 n=1 Tax=Daphnia magna TaxID=35525 RepID=UPI001E1BB215|nr:uncharacterized protein LOC116925000 [Daphnia magna]